jgi:cephalosporin-C deacetylase-like acetyl esterase
VPSLAQAAEDWKELPKRGVATLIIRVRGYPGSCADVPQLIHHAGHHGGGDWITYGLEVPLSDRGFGCDWSFSYAAADVVNACRALRTMLSAACPGAPIFMHGESFGGALAVIAASQLAEFDEPARLVIGLPTMGDWPWRMGLPENPRGESAGERIRRCISDHTNLRGDITTTLRVFDAAVHARRITCPVLCKLAARDDVVPAPAAAAVFNALGADPGLKWRFVTHYGHFDGGITDLRRHALFQQVATDFLDPSRPVEDAMAPWEPVMTGGMKK